MALRIIQLEEIQALLREMPKLVKLYEKKNMGFLNAVYQWLKQMETILKNNRLHIVSHIAALRGTIISTERGGEPKPNGQQGRFSKKKAAESVAIKVLREVCSIIEDAIASRVAQFAEAEKLTRQMISIAAVKGITKQCKALSSHQQALNYIQSSIASDQDLAGYYVMVTGLVGIHDIKVFIDRALTEVSS